MLQPDPIKRIVARDALQSPLFRHSINELQSSVQTRSDHYYPTMLRRDEKKKTSPKGKEKRQESSVKAEECHDSRNESAVAKATFDHANSSPVSTREVSPPAESQEAQCTDEHQGSVENSPNTILDFADASYDRRGDLEKVDRDYSDQKVKGEDVAVIKQSATYYANDHCQSAAVVKSRDCSTHKTSRPKSLVRAKEQSFTIIDGVTKDDELNGADAEEMETLEIRNDSSHSYCVDQTTAEVADTSTRVDAMPCKIIEGETEQLAAQLEEMGALAERLAAMVQESKGKLSQMQEISALKSPRVHHMEKRSMGENSSKVTLHNRRASFSSRFTSHESQRIPDSKSSIVHSPPQAAMNRSGGMNSLRRKLSHTLMIRKESTQSKIPFPSTPVTVNVPSSQHPIGDRLSLDERAEEISMQTPMTPRRQKEGVTRASSTRGRTLSQFLTRYGVRRAPNALDTTVETDSALSHHVYGTTSSFAPPTPLQPQAKAEPIALLTRSDLIDAGKPTKESNSAVSNRDQKQAVHGRPSVVNSSIDTPRRANRPLSRLYQTPQKTPIHALHSKQEVAPSFPSIGETIDPATAAANLYISVGTLNIHDDI